MSWVLSSARIPRDRMAEGEWEPRHAHRLIRDELMVEGNAGLNLATFTQTWVEIEVRALLDGTRRTPAPGAGGG